jgi:tape measure domain-containing protein|nr:MAG TPA: tail tape measure [Caudoviricetes sp.]
MAESYSVKAILSAQDKNFSSIMKSCQGYANNLKTTLTGGLGFGAMAAIGGKAMSLVTNSVSDLSKETIETSDSMYKLQAAMRFSGYSEAEIQRIAGATGTLKTYADKTVFSLQDVMSTFGSLSANGIKDADKLTEAVGNAVAVFGGGAKEYSSVALAFSQAMAAGALHAQDWNQIINASPQLAGGLRKELIKLNPTLGNDFKGAMEKGAITADMLGQAINNIGMTDMAKEAATSVTTFEGAMGNMEASAVSGMMNLYDTFAKPKVIDAINGMTSKVEAGFDKLSTGIPKAIKVISPYWDVFKDDAVKVGKAFGEAAKSIVGEVENLTGAFGKKESVENFSDSLGTATDALTTFADFLKDHDKEVAKAITLLPKLYVAFKGFKIVSAVAPGVKTFAGAIVSMTGKGIATLAGKLFGVAAGEKAVGTASKESSGTIVESAKAFVAIGAGVALIAAGFSLLAYSAVQIAQAGPLAAGVLIGMTVAVAGLMVVAKNVAPAMTAGATGFIAFGAAVLIAAAGIAILSLAAVNLANAGPLAIGCMVGMVAAIAGLALGAAALGPALTAGAVGLVAFGVAILLVSAGALLASVGLAIVAGVLPTIVQYGIQGAACIATLGAGMIVFGAGAAVAGAGCIVLGAGLVVVGAGLTVVGVGLAVVGAAILIVAAGVLVLAAGAIALGAGLTVAGAGLTLMGAAFPLVSAGALGAVGALTALLGLSVGLAAGMGASAAVVIAFGAAMAGGAVGTLAMVVALKSVNSSMKSIAGNAKSAQNSLTSMRSSVNVVNSGLDALGNKAKSAINSLTSQFSNAEGKAKSSGQAVGNNFNNGVSNGMNRAVSTARSMSASTVVAMRSAGSGSYSCGVYIGAGLANGMASQVGRVRSVAAQLAAAAEAAIRAKAQIHSPSRVSDKLGSYFGIGWVNAILGKVKLARKAAAQLVQIPELATIPDIGMNIRTSIDDLNDDYEYTRNETYTIYIPVEVDGRQVAKATAKYTKAEIEQQRKRDLRKQGKR